MISLSKKIFIGIASCSFAVTQSKLQKTKCNAHTYKFTPSDLVHEGTVSNKWNFNWTSQNRPRFFLLFVAPANMKDDDQISEKGKLQVDKLFKYFNKISKLDDKLEHFSHCIKNYEQLLNEYVHIEGVNNTAKSTANYFIDLLFGEQSKEDVEDHVERGNSVPELDLSPPVADLSPNIQTRHEDEDRIDKHNTLERYFNSYIKNPSPIDDCTESHSRLIFCSPDKIRYLFSKVMQLSEDSYMRFSYSECGLTVIMIENQDAKCWCFNETGFLLQKEVNYFANRTIDKHQKTL